jgi:hypothetical protein
LALIKHHYCTSKKVGIYGKWVLEPLSRDLQSSLFKLTMKNQVAKAMAKPRDENLMIRLWCQLATNSLLVVQVSLSVHETYKVGHYSGH